MNIVLIDSDNENKEFLTKYCALLNYQLEVFSSINDFHYLNEKSIKHTVDFTFIAISGRVDAIFEDAEAIKNLNDSVLVFILSSYREDFLLKSLKYGDGYLLKPFSCDFFLATINHHTSRAQLNRLLAKKNQKLLDYQQHIDQEYEIVEGLFFHHCKKHLINSDLIRYYTSPASLFNGDLLLTEYGPSGSLYMVVGDVTGHGLPAAVGALPVFSAFRAMVKKGKSVGGLAAAMNLALRTLLPDHMMMATSLLELNYATGQLVIWSGGMPDAVIVDHQGQLRQRIRSQHPPLAVVEPENFRQDVQIVQLDEGDRLYFFTDGIEESRNANDDMFGEQKLYDLFSGKADAIFNNIMIAYQQHQACGRQQNDDITLVELIYTPIKNKIIETDIVKTPVRSIPWTMQFNLLPDDLKYTDPVAQIINLIDNSIDIDPHKDYISTILSELYNNALEHGLLQLDSSIKKSQEGFVDYYLERKKRLSKLSSGTIDIVFEYRLQAPGGDGELSIDVSDSGAGFDYNAVPWIKNQSTGYGRGLHIVHALCDQVTFSEQGSRVKVVQNITRF
ncbi:MAG: fused response regulator/phosphatase [Cellvibrionaceae bacterium]|nr:fused response regulator/phosphatase [Cellvibrionaceae bacterium]